VCGMLKRAAVTRWVGSWMKCFAGLRVSMRHPSREIQMGIGGVHDIL
jgi:hypothetical protein